ncbi:hypothetical protein [Wolbachia endosymbiont (group B) of Eucosma cana]|uniref:hypothetical protein n=1 Tax=Wolbachia endosymbiont (group B) of Eucosma cana TaxID=2954012 RepID=UPI002227C12D|nr:hypothetical protein [Wolbachia endosymbiont (group B) of Eucosma cana]
MNLEHLRREGLDNRSLELKQKLKQDVCKPILGVGLSVAATVLFNEISKEFGESSVPSFIIGAGVGALSMAYARRASSHVSTNVENVATEQPNILGPNTIHASTNVQNVVIKQLNILGPCTIHTSTNVQNVVIQQLNILGSDTIRASTNMQNVAIEQPNIQVWDTILAA